MGFSKATRKFGDGYTYWKAHAVAGDHSNSPFDGEIGLYGNAASESGMVALAEAGVATTSLGAYTAGAEFNVEFEIHEDEITQEAFPVQAQPIAGKATFKVMMSMGDAEKLAIACGLTAANDEANVLAAGDDALTVIIGLRSPAELSLIHWVVNSQVGSGTLFDVIYMPRVTVNPSINLVFDQKGVRQAEVIFNLQPSHQDGTSANDSVSEDMYLDGSGTFGVAKILYQDAAA